MLEGAPRARPTPGIRGISLPEILVVVTIISLAITVAIPLVSGAIRSAELRAATDQLRVSLQAARMIAVSRQGDVEFRIVVHPGNRYEYEDSAGRTRSSIIPSSVCIAGTGAPILTFRANGSVSEGAATVLVNVDREGGATTCDPTAAGFEVRTNLVGETRVSRLAP